MHDFFNGGPRPAPTPAPDRSAHVHAVTPHNLSSLSNMDTPAEERPAPESGADSAQGTSGEQAKPKGARKTKRRRPNRVGHRNRRLNRLNDKENADRRTGAIEAAIQRISMLQNAIAADTDDDDDDSEEGSEFEDCADSDLIGALHNVDAKTLGFIACAHETMKYLTECGGIPRDDPMMVNLRNRLIQGLNNM